jgi:hypothetical protein
VHDTSNAIVTMTVDKLEPLITGYEGASGGVCYDDSEIHNTLIKFQCNSLKML